MKKLCSFMALLLGTMAVFAVEPPYAWRVNNLGTRIQAPIDTLPDNYAQRSVPSEIVSDAYATTGNLGGEGMNMVFYQRPATSDFYFRDALAPWMPSQGTMKWYNTRYPMTLLSYNFGGGRDNEQNRLQATFSANTGKNLQVGALLDYLYSKGSYNFQAAKDLVWGFSTSYITDRWQINAYYNHWNLLNKENGGITDPLYITDPGVLQGGDDNIEAKSIPTNLTDAHTRLVGQQLFANTRYVMGSYRQAVNPEDSTVTETFVPAAAVFWTFNYRYDRHKFINGNASEGKKFWENTYFDPSGTNDVNSFWSIQNYVGLQLLEGYKKFIPVTLSAYLRHEVRHFTQATETLSETATDLTPLPENIPGHSLTQQRLWVGGQVARRTKGLIDLSANAEIGLNDAVLGTFFVDGTLGTHIPIAGRNLDLTANAGISRVKAQYFMSCMVSNHFIWNKNFDKINTVNVGGSVNLPWTGTRLLVDYRILDKYVYFGLDQLPTQHNSPIHVFSTALEQNLHVGILNWDNRVTFQSSSEASVLPLPKLVVYSNLFLKFKVARVLDVQLGVDCDYYTRYYAPEYQPAIMAFCVQNHTEVGNYPFMNLYANFKLSKARFYIMLSHFNQGLFGGKDYFSMPLYPLNPRRLQLGVSVDFAN